MEPAHQESGFPSLSEEEYRRILRLCLFYLGRREDAEDAAQEVMEKVLRHRRQFRGEANPATWMYRIAVNTALNLRRRRSLIQWLSLTSIPEAAAPFLNDPALASERTETEQRRRAILLEGIERLSPREKTAFYLFHYENLPQKEISRIMNASLPAVEALVHKAIKKIKKVRQTLEGSHV